MSGALALPLPRPRRQIWSIGGGKGGIGKSLLAASLGWQLARLGKRTVLVDADLGGANLHTCLGLPTPALTLGDFILRRVERIEDVVVDTPFPRLRLISGASDVLGAANINYQQKLRVLNKLRGLDVDVVLIDLGAGTAHNIIDFFLISDISLLAVVPEPTSIENGYRFIKSALYRRLRTAARTEAVRDVIDAALGGRSGRGVRSPVQLLAEVERADPLSVAPLRRELADFHPRFIVNQVRSEADVSVGHQLVTACARHLGVRASYAGCVHYDDLVWRAVRRRRLFAADDPDCPPAQEIRHITRGLVEGETLSLTW
ncbi:MAG TPA: P-loop NTPase [Vicinamibacteria bacterium]|nr:P-loop NTPase [Vicinamibacteria bacterium]